MKRVSTLALVLLTFSGAAASKDLAGVFEDAVHNDPVIRQAEANRMAAREAKPQAWAAVLPQLNGSAAATRDHNSGFQDEIFIASNPANPNGPGVPLVLSAPSVTDTTTQQWGVTLRQNVFS